MKRRAGLTLIGLVVIIMILGILAGVAAPKLLKTSGNATDNGLRQSLSIVRDAIELYAAEHDGVLPPCTSGTGIDFKTALCPQYIRGTFPACPVGAKTADVVPTTGAMTGAASPGAAWKYNTLTGAFICDSAVFSQSQPTVKYEAF